NLVKREYKYQKTKSFEHKIFEQEDIKAILDSEVIYSGHSKTAKRTFFDNHHRVACEHDYIFKDKSSTYFVVEEKFRYKRDPKKQHTRIITTIGMGFMMNHMRNLEYRKLRSGKKLNPHFT